jgi:3',5'-cyclic AMP phosphodiesterase CpdA
MTKKDPGAEMKKKICVLLIIFAFVTVGAFLLSACNNYSYEPVEDFFNISLTFAGSGSTSRAFSFMTNGTDYENKCAVQLDPAGEKDAEPKFGSKDNILLETATRQHTHIKTYYVHSAYTTELTPGTKYFYRVGCPEEDKWSPWGVFTTDDGDDSFSFLFVTDMQSDGDKYYQILSENIRKAISESPQAEFVLSTGDQIEYGFLQGDWDKFFRYIQDVILNNTFAVVNGNHEISTYLMEANFYLPLELERYCYAFEYGNCLFMVLDNNGDMPEQLEWMEGVMAASSAKWRIIGMHMSPYSPGNHADQLASLEVKRLVTPFAARHSVDLVLSGHDHIYSRTCPIDENGTRAQSEDIVITEMDGYTATTHVKPGGPIYISNRTIGTKFYNKSNSLYDHLIDKGDPGKIQIPIFSVINIEGNKLTFTAYEYHRDTTKDIKIYDYFEIIK